ncbi:hypothetical protein DRW48_10405 [Paracoccus suum]|uniref:Uncharacterized protein n=1 Tax=Paracoccus suum TaxID=2259340 RepID=A0A344PKZ1_9RHOB|nr:hypothetical protein [Paracoccus suum]AXC50046.1 hypothetical protein DRW48_10405 [Paracoccus suum]
MSACKPLAPTSSAAFAVAFRARQLTPALEALLGKAMKRQAAAEGHAPKQMRRAPKPAEYGRKVSPAAVVATQMIASGETDRAVIIAATGLSDIHVSRLIAAQRSGDAA